VTEYKEIGVIPYIEKNNSFRFIIVTSRRHPKRWIFPKGQVEPEMEDREAAINEAFEEAGVIGTIRGKAIRVQVRRKDSLITYKLYPFRISKLCRKWPERKVRKRSFAKAEKAANMLEKHPYAEVLEIFLKKYSKQPQ